MRIATIVPADQPTRAAYGQPNRDPRVVELLARLEIATQQRNTSAAHRIISDLSESPDGEWLLRQFFAVGLRSVASGMADTA